MDLSLHPKGSGKPLESVKQWSDLVRAVFWMAIWQPQEVALLKQEAEAERTERRQGCTGGGEKRWSLKTFRCRESLCCSLQGV